MLKIFQTLFFLFLSVGVSVAQISSVKVNSSSGSLGQNGIYYSLPRAVLQVDIIISKTESKPGPYAAYAQQVLGLTENVIMQPETTYAIKGIHLASFSEADPEALFFLNFGERSSKSDRAFLLQLQANGVLKGMNETLPEDENARKSQIELQQNRIMKDFDYFADLNQVVRVDTVIRRISVDTTNIEDIVINQKLVEKTMEERAHDAAKTYMDIHKNRLELLSGFQEVGYPAQSIQLMNDELKQMETGYLALFRGKRFVSEEKYTFYIVPKGDKQKQSYSVAKFSSERGLGDANASFGERINLMLETSLVTEALKAQDAGALISGVFYRVPESARVWINFNGTTYAQEQMLIPQLGVLQPLSTSKTMFSIDPQSGMLQSIEIK